MKKTKHKIIKDSPYYKKGAEVELTKEMEGIFLKKGLIKTSKSKKEE